MLNKNQAGLINIQAKFTANAKAARVTGLNPLYQQLIEAKCS